MSLISFIILNYNGYKETSKLVDAINLWDRAKTDFSVIVVDNCSKDNSFDNLKKRYSGSNFIDVISSEKNGGYSYGNNYGAKYAIKKYKPKFIAISNPDVEIEQDMICKLLDTFETDSRIGMCAPVMKSIDGSYNVYSQRLPTYQDDLNACSLRDQSKCIIRKGYKTLDPEGNFIVTEVLPGSFFVIRTDCFSQVGMFDEHIFLYCEERIIGKKLKEAGFIAITRADLFYVHAHAVSTRKSINTLNRWRHLLKSRLYYQKNYEHINFLQSLILNGAMQIFLLKLNVLLIRKSIKDKDM